MSLLGYACAWCADCATSAILTGVAKNHLTGNKIIDKVVYPVGIVVISCTVFDITKDHVENDISEMKEAIKGIKEAGEQMRKARKEAEESYAKYKEEKAYNTCEEEVKHNVFEETATRWSEDGKPIAGRYPYESNNEEEVKENGDS